MSKIIPYLVLFVFGFFSGKWLGGLTFCFIYFFLIKNVKVTFQKYTSEDEQYSNEDRYQRPYNQLENAYKILGLENNASLDEVKKARNRMIKKYHPDKLAQANETTKKQANERIILINEAYELIRFNFDS